MGIFTKHWRESLPATPPPVVEVKESKATAPAPLACKGFHAWGGKALTVDRNLHEVQNTAEQNQQCDCGKFLWYESLCGCSGKKHWEGKLIENPDYKGY